ncbi:Small GTPase like protein [Aduncisulcus paluster]|uniref:Small GTPase like protein n=1 Tax=Aduncisulcus paluster TaxID=2918883 RepID=A0ABQ5K650_9EUKA|nr:Small GTPase like protein [Aduncisulcus paluster]|eukprot:gnl/Carplike_NY0171/8834_a12279_152.p1 GENE.gnl/Carplike_NY0171/8834_a12279_152~~gnl/Carplike_NY0171/8834_a12279_152.p1  ORF type:complete len:228 (+),score=51.92 gnl/Carplike_NY0171/8834_a12279_152:29-712(+)
MSYSDSEEDDTVKQFRVVVLGDGSTGKTSLCSRFAYETFSQSYKQTIGAEFFSKSIKITDGQEVLLQVWDIGGQSIGHHMINEYIKNAQAVILLYDITRFPSFRNLQEWYRKVCSAAASSASGDDKFPYIALVGNKSDLAAKRAVKLARHESFARDNGMASFYVSARSGDQVDVLFETIAAALTGVKLSPGQIEGDGVIPALVPADEKERRGKDIKTQSNPDTCDIV